MKMQQKNLNVVPSVLPTGLGRTTWEERRSMTARELIKLMGPLHVNHSDFQQKPRSLLPMENLAGRQPVFSRSSAGMWESVKMLLAWAAR